MKAFVRKIGVKWLVVIIVLLVFTACAIFDAFYKNVYDIDYSLNSVGREDGEEVDYEGPLSGAYKIYISVALTRGGKPVANHIMWMESPTMIDNYGDTVSAGQLKQNQVKTDENGIALFEYFPYKTNKFKPAGVVNFDVRDMDGSIIIEMYIGKKFDIDLRENTNA